MTVQEFKSSLSGEKPPICLTPELKALWYTAKNEWHKAHELIQYESGENCAFIHAHLHRIEGDTGNADYWYSKAGAKQLDLSLEDEFHHILNQLI